MSNEGNVEGNGDGKCKMLYVPDVAKSGEDICIYGANDCTFDDLRWASQARRVVINVVPSGIAGTVHVDTQVSTTIELSSFSIASNKTDPPLHHHGRT